jgi:hypothetical protein
MDDWLAVFLPSLFVLRQLVLSWGFVFRLVRVTRRLHDCQVRGTKAGRACHGKRVKQSALCIIFPCLTLELFCSALFVNLRSCIR